MLEDDGDGDGGVVMVMVWGFGDGCGGDDGVVWCGVMWWLCGDGVVMV